MKEYWRKPELNASGQQMFWDEQASIYEGADMTVDNKKEMDIVINRCREVDCREIITLGGAVGCRDPKMILERLYFQENRRPLPKVIFNDLSPKQVEWAKDRVLKPFEEKGVEIEYVAGEIKDICAGIKTQRPRRLIIGIYQCRSFFEAHPDAGYPLCGYDEYLKNHDILGDELLMDWMKYDSSGGLVSARIRSQVSHQDDEKTCLLVKNGLRALYRSADRGDFEDIIALQIIGRALGRSGFFLSHWYTPEGFRRMLRNVFPRDKFSVIESYFAKGMIFAVDPIGTKPEGVVTVLNNVIGNVLPHSQFESLSAIKKLISV